MSWTHMHCDLPIFESAEAQNKYMEERQAKHAALVAERERIITLENRPAPYNDWLAHLVGDWRSGHGNTVESAIGDLWLMYSHEIIEKCRTL